VRRHLSRDSEKTRFELDGVEATSKVVMEHMEELQVQVGNLWCVLALPSLGSSPSSCSALTLSPAASLSTARSYRKTASPRSP